MRYDEFIDGVINDASIHYPLLFNNNKRELYHAVLSLGGGASLELVETLMDWKWYTPSPFKIARFILAASAIAPIILIMKRLDMLNKNGIKATCAVAYIVDEYRDRFRCYKNNTEEINRLKKDALDDLLSQMH